MTTDISPIAEVEEQELYEHHRILVDKGQAMLRMDKFLQMRLEGVSRTKIQAAAKAGCILARASPRFRSVARTGAV